VIFVTVGTDGPFDRLVHAVDQWAGQVGRKDVFAQIGKSSLRPRHIEYVDVLEPQEFRRRFALASVVISHAGMGTILSALQFGKPLLVMPRRAALDEQRNDHQLATARHLRNLGRIAVASDDTELRDRLGQLDELVVREPIGAYAQPELIAAIGEFIHSGGSYRR
jgi:UDP-N-acetylglucosamine transferase subunit ALG13